MTVSSGWKSQYRMSEWMSEWENEWVSEWICEWINYYPFCLASMPFSVKIHGYSVDKWNGQLEAIYWRMEHPTITGNTRSHVLQVGCAFRYRRRQMNKFIVMEQINHRSILFITWWIFILWSCLWLDLLHCYLSSRTPSEVDIKLHIPSFYTDLSSSIGCCFVLMIVVAMIIYSC